MEFKVYSDSDKRAVKDYVDSLPQGKGFIVKITRRQTRRTVNQNRLYWLYVACIMQETGNSKDVIHEWLKVKFLGNETVMIGDEAISVPVSTARLNTAQFTHYIDRIVTWASSELGIILPDPEESYFEQFYEAYKNFI